MVVLAIGLLGLVFGSFCNALVWRLHEKKTFLNDRSECIHCHHKLAAIDLIPVISWLMLRGRCRYCSKSISWQYPLVELIVSGLFVASWFLWPVAITGRETAIFALWLIEIVGLTALAVYDLKWMELPTSVIYFLLLIAILMALVNLSITGFMINPALQYLAAMAIGGGIFYLLYQISDGKWIGGGDVRLGFLLGLLAASIGQSILVIFLSSLLGTIVSLPLMAIGKLGEKRIIPFGPFLIAALIIVVFYGQDIIRAYLSLIRP